MMILFSHLEKKMMILFSHLEKKMMILFSHLGKIKGSLFLSGWGFSPTFSFKMPSFKA